MENYKVTCTNCGKNVKVGIKDGVILWGKTEGIVSGRKRLDGNWGWQCMCGNNTLLSKQESRSITNLQSPDPKEIQHVIDNLIVESDRKFLMARA